MIQTRFEKDGQWSSSQYSEDFMIELSSETGIPLISIGTSSLGNNIYAMEIGNADRVLCITSGVHRNELASHEAGLKMARDLAYNANGEFDDILEHYKVCIVPTVVPDVTSRVNSQFLDINRDGYKLESFEMRALMSYITKINPHVHIDFHERAGDEDMKVEFINTSILDPNSEGNIEEYSSSLENYIRTELEKEQFRTSPYPQTIIGPGMSVALSSILGSVALTPETHMSAPGINRVQGLMRTFKHILDWCIDNRFELDSMKNEFISNIPKRGEQFVLLNGNNQYYYNASKVGMILPDGYMLHDIELFSKWIETFKIHVNEDGFVPINQKSSRILAHLLDPLSDMKVVDSDRVIREPDRRTDGRYTKVLLDEWQEIFIKNYF